MKNEYTGQNAEAEEKVFDIIEMKDGYNTYYEDVYKKFFTISGLDIIDNKRLEVLEVGCGSGEFGRKLAKMGYKVTGVDLSRTLVKVANIIAKKEKLNYKAYTQNIFNYKKNNFDFVLCANFLHHFEDLSAVLIKIKSLIRKKGEVVIIEPNGSNFVLKISEHIRKDFWPFNKMTKLGTSNETNHSSERYEKKFVEAGFKLVFCKGFNAKTIFHDYGFIMNILLRIKYFLQNAATLFMKSSNRGTVIVMKFIK